MIRAFAPDIIHIHNEFAIGFAGMRYARELNIRSCTRCTRCTTIIPIYRPMAADGHRPQISHRYVGFIARRADVITGPSKKCADICALRGVHRPVHTSRTPWRPKA
jgi:1,2-diacylglycerol 3-alpha-glucosyltransferase